LKVLVDVFEQCCKLKSQDLVKSIGQATAQLDVEAKPSKSAQASSNLVNSANNFIKVLTEQLIVSYCAISESVSNKSQVAASNSDRDEKDRVRIKELEGLISILYSAVSGEVVHQLHNMREGVAKSLLARGDNWDGIDEQYERTSHWVDHLFEFNSGFFSIVTLYT